MLNKRGLPYSTKYFRREETEKQKNKNDETLIKEGFYKERPYQSPLRRPEKRGNDALYEPEKQETETKRNRMEDGNKNKNEETYAMKLNKNSDIQKQTNNEKYVRRNPERIFNDKRSDGYVERGLFCIRRNGTVLEDYVEQIYNVYGRDSIDMVYQVSNRKIVAYVKTREIAIKISEEELTVKGNKIKIDLMCPRPMAYKIKNVMPWLTAEEIVIALESYGLVNKDSIKHEYVKVGESKIRSRTITVEIKKFLNAYIPKYVAVKIAMDYYRWYIAPADTICFNCRKIGHWMQYCEEDYTRENIDIRYQEEKGEGRRQMEGDGEKDNGEQMEEGANQNETENLIDFKESEEMTDKNSSKEDGGFELTIHKNFDVFQTSKKQMVNDNQSIMEMNVDAIIEEDTHKILKQNGDGKGDGNKKEGTKNLTMEIVNEEEKEHGRTMISLSETQTRRLEKIEDMMEMDRRVESEKNMVEYDGKNLEISVIQEKVNESNNFMSCLTNVMIATENREGEKNMEEETTNICGKGRVMETNVIKQKNKTRVSPKKNEDETLKMNNDNLGDHK